MNVAGDHWSQVYRSKDADQVSWFQADPVMSMRLLDARFPDVTVLDVSGLALTIVRQRLAERHEQVSLIVADLLHWTPHRQWDSWHDRAVFHFLTDQRDRTRYVEVATRAVATGGTAVIE